MPLGAKLVPILSTTLWLCVCGWGVNEYYIYIVLVHYRLEAEEVQHACLDLVICLCNNVERGRIIEARVLYLLWARRLIIVCV